MELLCFSNMVLQKYKQMKLNQLSTEYNKYIINQYNFFKEKFV